MGEQASRTITVYGATSFVGQLVCRHLLERHGGDGSSTGIRWRMAGRSIDKLRQVRDALGAEAANIPLVVAEADDAAALERMCAETDVVLTTVGPYAFYGSTLVGVCAESGTDYCDLTGEVQWIRRMLDTHEATARRSGARIVHCAGFDSVPSDMGVYFLQKTAQERYGKPASRVRMRLRAAKGGFSGGTVASLGNALKEAGSDPSVRTIMSNPYALCPPDARSGVRQDNVTGPRKEADLGTWAAPFIMAAINTRVVHRSNALVDHAWGADFRYDEAMQTGRGAKGGIAATAVAGGLGAYAAAMSLSPTRWLLNRFVNPKPGEGPSPQAQEEGFFDMRFYGDAGEDQRLCVGLKGQGDPGYAWTSRAIGEVAACMAQDEAPRAAAGGFWTPSTLMGDALLDRLTAHAGVDIGVLD